MPRKHLIAHLKVAKDQKKAKIWQRIIRELYVAVRQGGPDSATNPGLRVILEKAKSNNVPKETIKRNIEKASGASDGDDFKEVMYEGYAPGGVAVMVKALTDNINRTVAIIRSNFKKNDGEMGKTGSVAYSFDKKGQLIFEKADFDEEDLMMIALEAGADDFIVEDEYFEVICEPEAFLEVKKAIDDCGVQEYIEADVKQIPNMTVAVNEENQQKIEKLISMMEECDDVQEVVTNME